MMRFKTKFCTSTICKYGQKVDDLQYGFRKKSDVLMLSLLCDMSLIILLQRTVRSAAALDIFKAFDTVSHQKLMDKLSQAGVPRWIANLLSNWYSKLYARCC